MQKVSNLARQIEKINMEFLETKMLDRAVIINVFSLPDKEPFSDKPEEHGPAHELQPLEQPVEAEQQSERRLNAPSDDPSPTSFTPFSRYSCSGFHNFEVSCRARLASGDHLGLVRGSNPSDAFDWVGYFQPKLNEYDGISKFFLDTPYGPNRVLRCNNQIVLNIAIKNSYEFLKFQRSLLSLAPPTRISRFDQDPEAKPPLISWIIEHDAFQELHKKPGPQTVYIHAGLQGAQAVDMKAITEKLYIAYEYVKDEDIGPTGTGGQPGEAAFYFEFDRNDSRRSSIEAMVTSYICAFACRFWYNEEHEVRWSAEYLAVFRCWSLEDLVVLFLNAHEANSMKNVTVILGQFDQCDEAGRQVFLAALRRRQSYNEIDFKLVITTNRPEESISEVLPPGCSISLDDCPLPLEEYLRYPRSNGAIDDKVQSLLSWRPELAQVRPQIRYILEKFVDNHKLQEIFMGFLANYKRGCSSDDAVKIIQEISSIENHSVLQAFISSLSGEKQHWAKQVYSWVKHAAEPLTVEILAQAIQMSTSPGGTKFTGIGYDEFYDDVQQSLRGIVVRDGLEVSFSDEVFYQLPGIGTYRTTDETQQQTYRAHADMAAVCLRYLLSPEGQAMLTSLSVENQGIEDPEGSLLMLPRNSLVSYALRFWMVHYRASGDHRPIDLVRELFQDRDKRQTWAEAHYVTSNPFTRIQREYLSPLPYMSMFGFDECVLEQIETEKQSEGWTKTCWLAITEAARSGHSKTVSLLLDHTVVDFAGLREALQWAANYGRGGALDMLTAKAREIEGFQWPQYILHRAAVAGLENLISALIDAGHDVNEMDATGKRRAIHAAVGSGHDRVVKLLLDSGRVDITLLNYVNDSPLMLAVALGSPETLELLIAAGASLDVYDNLGSPPLRAAIDYAQHKAVGILIDAQVSSDRGDINVINNERDEPMVPIVEAANNGFRECTRVLIDKGADVNKYARYGNALVQAVVGGPYIDICRMLLENGANPNQSLTDHSSYENRENLFLQAISTGDKPLVALMLDHGANVNFADPARTECVTPLSYAATFRGRAHEMMDLLLERGADPNLVPEDKPESRSPLFSAAFSGADPRCVEMLINHGADVHWRRKSDRWSVLHSAYDLPDMLSVLLEHGADVNATDEDNWSTLTLAARWNCTKSLEVLLNQKNPKADLEVQTQGGDVSGGTALTRACQHGHVDAAKLLLEAGANINHKQSDGSFALGLFLRECPQEEACVDIVETALKYNADLSLTDDKGNTVLHHITNSTPFSVVRRLVEEGAPVSAVNDAGYNSLAWAVSCNNVDAARYLITVKGVRADIYHPSFGSILHMAVKDPSVDLVRQLIKAGADHSVVDPEFGETVLCSAVRNGNWRAREKIIRYLVGEVGVDVNGAGGEWGNALLQLVAERPEIPLVKYLLRHGARPTPDAVDRLGRTPAHWAAGGPVQAVNGISGIVKILFKAGFDFTVRDYYGRTPLHFAAASCDLNETRYLLKRLSEDAKDFDINIADVDGWTPLMWACRRTRTFPEDLKEVARLLIDEYGADIYARSTNGEWSPRKVARFCVSYNTDAITEVLLPAEDGQKRRGSDGEEETLDLQIQPGEWHYELCVGCGLVCKSASPGVAHTTGQVANSSIFTELCWCAMAMLRLLGACGVMLQVHCTQQNDA